MCRSIRFGGETPVWIFRFESMQTIFHENSEKAWITYREWYMVAGTKVRTGRQKRRRNSSQIEGSKFAF